MEKIKSKKIKTLDSYLDWDAYIFQFISLLASIGVFMGIVALLYSNITLALIVGVIASVVCFQIFHVVISYFRVQSEILRTLKRIESKLDKPDKD
ncbi:Flp pilus assembly protein TadB [Dysgonomonas hofstadii]|uniref:Flp pilus assembly protein TadB n=1 Tax=Dysgonomonas hofstadii TaxID=637886 RepID=A0A840CVV9_9BACT|nr:hypothetical protein [Dysgonomonas hofstadii]MBB4036612.1 Flp pilus assembly protein TadB [Dysgonomonas hofstadii]